jgi:hypothetical protein
MKIQEISFVASVLLDEIGLLALWRALVGKIEPDALLALCGVWVAQRHSMDKSGCVRLSIQVQ